MWGFESSIPSQPVAHSSSGPGHLPLKEEIRGSNPLCASHASMTGPAMGPLPFPGGARGSTGRQPNLRASPRFRRFWLGEAPLAHRANAILLGLLVTVVNRTGSTIHSSLLVLTFVAPSAVFGVAGGVVADRIPKRELLLTAGLLRTALCLLFLHGDSGVAAIYATNLGLSVITQFASPAEAAALPAVVLEHQLVAATAALNLETIFSQVLGGAYRAVAREPSVCGHSSCCPRLPSSSHRSSTRTYPASPVVKAPDSTQRRLAQSPHPLTGIREAVLESLAARSV